MKPSSSNLYMSSDTSISKYIWHDLVQKAYFVCVVLHKPFRISYPSLLYRPLILNLMPLQSIFLFLYIVFEFRQFNTSHMSLLDTYWSLNDISTLSIMNPSKLIGWVVSYSSIEFILTLELLIPLDYSSFTTRSLQLILLFTPCISAIYLSMDICSFYYLTYTLVYNLKDPLLSLIRILRTPILCDYNEFKELKLYVWVGDVLYAYTV